MIELIKKVMFTGVGMASMTKDKIAELAKEIIEKGKLSEKEGKALLAEIVQKSAEARKELEVQTDKLVQASLKKMKLASRDDLLKLENKLKKLAKSVKALESKE